MRAEPETTLITVTYNSASMLRQCWDSLPGNVRWIVVDNASTDDSVALASDLGADVIELTTNVGFSRANNVGLAKCGSEYVGFVNPDIVIDAAQIQSMVAHLDQHPGLAAPQLVYPNGETQASGRGYPTIWAKIANRLVGNRRNYSIIAESGATETISWAMGAAIFGRTDLVKSFGGWNEEYFLYYEDAEIGLRASKTGIPTTVCGTTRVIHHWGRDTTTFRWAPWKREFQSAFRFYRSRPYLLLPGSFDRLYPAYTRSWRRVPPAPCNHSVAYGSAG